MNEKKKEAVSKYFRKLYKICCIQLSSENFELYITILCLLNSHCCLFLENKRKINLPVVYVTFLQCSFLIKKERCKMV